MFGVGQLMERGVLGMNQRNTDYIQRYNHRSRYPLVDDKLQTKRLAIEAGLAVPELYGVVATHHDSRNVADIVAERDGFVIKPAHGSGGDGILVVSGHRAHRTGGYRLVNGQVMSETELRHHLSNIVSGQFSLAGTRDTAVIEYCVRNSDVFGDLCYQGVPDIRVLVFKGYPIMAMARLPTRMSRGKANLHQGAVGAGIDIGTGSTLGGVLSDRRVDEHPDTGAVIADIRIPDWDKILNMAASCYELTGLGYLGVDIVLDAQMGALILELNARPGLAIQIANEQGLKVRLGAVEALEAPDDDPACRVAWAQALAGS